MNISVIPVAFLLEIFNRNCNLLLSVHQGLQTHQELLVSVTLTTHTDSITLLNNWKIVYLHELLICVFPGLLLVEDVLYYLRQR